MTEQERKEMMEEINAINAKMRAVKEANTVKCDWPKSKRTYAYRTSPAIKANDLAI